MFAIRARPTLGIVFLLGFLVTGCGGETATAPPPVTVGTSIPVELQGTWSTVLAGTNQQVTLRLTERGYQINRGVDQTNGRVAVTGDRIDFSESSSCSAGTGAYRWSLSGKSLAFSTFAADPCPGRSEALAGLTYTKSS